MPTAILQLEASALPPALDIAPGYGHALVLFRWHGRPVGQSRVPVVGGTIRGEVLRQAALDCAGEQIAACRIREHLGLGDEAPGPAAPSCTIAVCTRDRPEDLTRCLEALSRLPDDGQEIVVIDSASASDATRRVVERFPRVRYVREERPGLDIARNRALAEARHEVVAYTDDDAAPDEGWLRALRAGFADPRTLCVTGLTLPIELETPAQEWFELSNGFGRGYRRIVHDGIEADPFLVARVGAGVNMALRRSVLELVGGFDEALDAGTPTQSGGDHDIFTRILAAGYCIVYEPSALNWHRHRREWHELQRALYGYGVGVYAYITRHFLNGEWRAPLLAVQWLRSQLPALVGSLLGRPGRMPSDLAIAELRGCLAGPGAYLRSRRRLRKQG